MLAAHSIALACCAMALLTLSVAARLFSVRLKEMRRQGIGPQAIATSRLVTERLQDVQASDNYKNLFEMPVLFYAVCALLIATGAASDFFALGAWLFVVLRAVHSFIHCTYNKVSHRFGIFLLSLLVLIVLWIGFFLRILDRIGQGG
jgi:hypothetical protein